MLSTFSVGPDAVAAAAILFTRASDAEEKLPDLLQPLSDRDANGWKEAMGWYSYHRFSNATGV